VTGAVAGNGSERIRILRRGCFKQGRHHGVDWVDMSTPLLPEVVPAIDANPVSFYWGRGGVCNCCGSVGFPSKRLWLQFCADLLCSATSHITSTTIPN